MQEFLSLLELLGMLFTDPRTGVLIMLLLIACVIDCRMYKIPNWLTLSGMAFGLLYAAEFPFSGHYGLLWAMGGLLVGFFMTLPLYMLKVMGAGDVKLMAMAGAFLGGPDVFYAALTTFIVGGISAIGFALFHGVLGRMLGNIRDVARLMIVSAIGGADTSLYSPSEKSVGKMPYGVSIGIGVIGYVTARQLGYL